MVADHTRRVANEQLEQRNRSRLETERKLRNRALNKISDGATQEKIIDDVIKEEDLSGSGLFDSVKKFGKKLLRMYQILFIIMSVK